MTGELSPDEVVTAGASASSPQFKQRGDFLERMTQHVFENDAAALCRCQFDEARYREPHRLLVRHGIVWAWRRVCGGLANGVERLTHTHLVAAQVVERTIVGNAKQPGAERGQFLHLRKQIVSAGERVLDDVFAVSN
jgi:hypothetical protein